MGEGKGTGSDSDSRGETFHGQDESLFALSNEKVPYELMIKTTPSSEKETLKEGFYGQRRGENALFSKKNVREEPT